MPQHSHSVQMGTPPALVTVHLISDQDNVLTLGQRDSLGELQPWSPAPVLSLRNKLGAVVWTGTATLSVDGLTASWVVPQADAKTEVRARVDTGTDLFQGTVVLWSPMAIGRRMGINDGIVTILQGPKGDKGDQGDKGDPGPAGGSAVTTVFGVGLNQTYSIPAVAD